MEIPFRSDIEFKRDHFRYWLLGDGRKLDDPVGIVGDPKRSPTAMWLRWELELGEDCVLYAQFATLTKKGIKTNYLMPWWAERLKFLMERRYQIGYKITVQECLDLLSSF